MDEQEEIDFNFWAMEIWPNGDIPQAAWLGWQARASKPGAQVNNAVPEVQKELTYDPFTDPY